jgi:hypothetical protein
LESTWVPSMSNRTAPEVEVIAHGYPRRTGVKREQAPFPEGKRACSQC